MATTIPDQRTEARPATRWSVGRAALVLSVLVGAVLRLWDLGSSQLSIDETYTALAARLPLVDLVRHIDATDPHGPLPYVLLRSVATFTTDIGALRAVSALASIAAVVVMAVWQRRAGFVGVVTTAVFALSPFQLIYARQIRMYGLLALAGVTVAWCAQRWLDDGRRRWAAGMAVAGLAVAFSHATGPILLGALLLIPLLRRDRAAWELRGAVAGALGLFAVTWGAHLVRWSQSSGELPTASLDWASIVVNETIAPVPGNRWLVLPLLVAGGAAIVAGRGSRARVWVCLFALPVLVLYASSLSRGVLVPKSLMAFAWGPSLAAGALAGWVIQRSRAAAAGVVTLIALVVLPFVPATLHTDESSRTTMAHLFDRVPVGDGFASIHGVWQTTSLLEWNGNAEGNRPFATAVQIGGIDVFAPEGGALPTRVWILMMPGDHAPAALIPCSPVEPVGSLLTVQCLETGSG